MSDRLLLARYGILGLAAAGEGGCGWILTAGCAFACYALIASKEHR